MKQSPGLNEGDLIRQCHGVLLKVPVGDGVPHTAAPGSIPDSLPLHRGELLPNTVGNKMNNMKCESNAGAKNSMFVVVKTMESSNDGDSLRQSHVRPCQLQLY